MSARLKLKKLKKQIEILRTHCAVIKANARYEAARYHALIRKNIVKIEACTELYPADTYRCATICLDTSVKAVTEAIVRKYTEQLSEYVRNELTSKYMFNRFGKFGVQLLAPALTEDHIEIHTLDSYGLTRR